MIVDLSELECKRNGCLEFLQQAPHVCLNHVEALDFLVVTHEHVTVDFVDEHLIDDIGFNLAGLLNKVPQSHTSTLIVWLVGINDVD